MENTVVMFTSDNGAGERFTSTHLIWSLFISFICTLLILILSSDPSLFTSSVFQWSKLTLPRPAWIHLWSELSRTIILTWSSSIFNALAKYVVPGSLESACACLQSSCAGQWEGCEVGDRVKGKVKGKQVWDWSNSNTLFTQLYSSHGHRISSLTHVTDWAPTFLALAGVGLEEELDGVLTNWYSWLKLISIF